MHPAEEVPENRRWSAQHTSGTRPPKNRPEAIQVPRTSDAARVSEAAQQPTILPWQLGTAAPSAGLCQPGKVNCETLSLPRWRRGVRLRLPSANSSERHRTPVKAYPRTDYGLTTATDLYYSSSPQTASKKLSTVPSAELEMKFHDCFPVADRGVPDVACTCGASSQNTQNRPSKLVNCELCFSAGLATCFSFGIAD